LDYTPQYTSLRRVVLRRSWMPILTFRVQKDVAEAVNALAKRNGISRNEFLTRAITSLLLQEELKGRDIRKLTASLMKKGLQKNESRARRMLEKSPFIFSWIQVAPSLLSKLTRPPSKPVKDWEMRVLRDLHRVAENMRFSSDESLEIAVDVLSEMIRSVAPQMENGGCKYKDRITDALYRLISSLFYPDRERAAEAYLFLCKKLDEEPFMEAPRSRFKL
jgi:ribbon-helix-helix CopG family protein